MLVRVLNIGETNIRFVVRDTEASAEGTATIPVYIEVPQSSLPLDLPAFEISLEYEQDLLDIIAAEPASIKSQNKSTTIVQVRLAFPARTITTEGELLTELEF